MTALAQTWPSLAGQLAPAGWRDAELGLVRRAHELALELFAGKVRGSGAPFTCHLVGTASATCLGGGGPAVVAAALVHAAYDQGDFGDRRPGAHPRHRRRLEQELGAEVERLVRAYHRLGWSPEVALTAAGRIGSASASERHVLLVRVANEVDDAADAGLVISGKAAHREHDEATHTAVVAIAEAVAAPPLVALARQVLLGPPPAVPEALWRGHGASTSVWPPSARPAASARAHHVARRGRRVVARALRRTTPTERSSRAAPPDR